MILIEFMKFLRQIRQPKNERNRYYRQNKVISSILKQSKEVMLCFYHLICFLNRINDVKEHLSVSKKPITVEHHQNRSEFKNIYCCLVHHGAVVSWFVVVVSEQYLFRNIEVYQAEKSDWKQDWQRDAVEERNKNQIQH